MLFNNRMRPAFATAGAPENGFSPRKKRNDALMLDANSEADDFGAFTSDQTRERAPRRERPAAQNSSKKGFNRMWIIAIAAVVAVVLLCVLVGAIILNSSGDIQYTDNTYLVYVEDSGNYRVAVNGTLLEETFDGETRVIPSLDRSFAYVECNAADGYLIYLLEGKKLTAITTEDSAVTEVLGYAENVPGILYREEGNVYIYSETDGEDLIEKNAEADNFLISGDATTVIYTRPLEDSATEDRIYLYRDGSSAPIGVKNCTPVKISDNGEYIYAYGYTSTLARKLYCITSEDGEKYPVCDSNFGGITAINVDGDEIIYYTSTDTKLNSFVYSAQKDESYEIAKGKGIFFPATIDPKIARHETFADCYLQSVSLDTNLLDEEGATVGYTYYLNKKYEAQSIASALGQFSPDGKYFYYVNSKNTLYRVDLSDLEEAPTKIYEDTIEFAVTQKGNVYMLDNQNFLYFYKASTGKKKSISKIATDISMHQYANQLYFVTEDETNVYVTEEGSAKELVKMDGIQLTALPEFNTGSSKKSFSYFYDENAGYSLFYTGNGKSFKLLTTECDTIAMSDIPDWLSWINDMFDGDSDDGLAG